MATFNGWTEEELYLALERANVQFHGNLCFNYRPERIGRRYNFRLIVVMSSRLKRKDLKDYPHLAEKYEDELMPDYIYPRGCKVGWPASYRPKPRGIATACWHASGVFYRELFKINPKGKIKTVLAYYVGEVGFDEKYPSTAHQNVGSMMSPAYMPDQCCCEMHDIGDF